MAAVVVAGSANAGIAPNVVDPFTTAQSFGTSPTAYTNISGSLFGQRNARQGNSGAGTLSATNNNVTFTFARGPFSASFVELNYRMSPSAAETNLSSISQMSIALSALNLNVPDGTAATGVLFAWSLFDSNGIGMYVDETLSANGTSTFNFASATVDDDGFDLTKVTLLTLRVSQVGGSTSGSYSTTSSSGTLSNFSYTLVPAPGALALLGAAGLVGARRRR
jgi:hypothetical protein